MLRKKISLQDKIDIFERYFEKCNEEINGQTIFEGYPIGQWAIQIRSSIKHDKKNVNPTEKQLERLSRLGILEKRIDSTIDEKIDALVEWYQNYPDIKVERRVKDNPISTETIEKLKQLAQSQGVEFSVIKEKYKKMQSYKEYVIQQDKKGKLTDEQRDRCKEGNLDRRFGYPTEFEELAEKYKIKHQDIANIIKKYGTFDNFIQMYRHNKVSIEEFDFFNDMIDIDIASNPYSERYHKLVHAIWGFPARTIENGENEVNDIIMFSSNAIDELLHNLNPRQEACLRERFGLNSGKEKSLAECENIFNVTKERVRQIEAKALRKLRKSKICKHIKPKCFTTLKESEFITSEKIDELSDLENELWNSNLFFKHVSLEDINFDTTKLSILSDFFEPLEEKKTSPEDMKKMVLLGEMDVGDVFLEQMNFSTRTFNALKRAGRNTLEDLANMTYEDLNRVEKMGDASRAEVIAKMKEYGILLNGENRWGLSTRLYNVLKEAGKNTLEDYSNMTYEDLKNIRGMGEMLQAEFIARMKEYGIIIKKEEDIKSEIEKISDKMIELKEIRSKKFELAAHLKALEEKEEQAQRLLDEYNKQIGDDNRINTD